MFTSMQQFERDVLRRRFQTIVIPDCLILQAFAGQLRFTDTLPDDAIVKRFHWEPMQGVFLFEVAHPAFAPIASGVLPTKIYANAGRVDAVEPAPNYLRSERRVKRLSLRDDDIAEAFLRGLPIADIVPIDAVIVGVLYDDAVLEYTFLISHPTFDMVPVSERYPSISWEQSKTL